MAEIVFFTPRSELDSKQNLDDFVSYCQNKLTLYEDQGGFATNLWHYNHKGKNSPMNFAKYKKAEKHQNYEPLDEPFLRFAKAYIRYLQSKKQVSSIADKLITLKALHDALIEVHGEADVLKVDGLIQLKVVDLLNARYVYEIRYRAGGHLESLYKFLREKSIVPTLPTWKRPWKRLVEKAGRVDKESRKWQQERCPSMRQILAIADCFAQAKTKQDQYWSSVLALLMFAPNRAGELQSLSVDSLHEEDGRLGVIWYGEKGFGETVKWVPKCMEEMVKEAFLRLIEIGRPAREAAKFAHKNPGKFFRHQDCVTPANFTETKGLNALEFTSAMGFSSNTTKKIRALGVDSLSAWARVNKNTIWLKRLSKKGNLSYQVLAQHVLQRYRRTRWPYLPTIDKYVWEALLLTRDCEFHKRLGPKPFSWVLPDINQINAQLSPRSGLKKPPKTIFQRFDIQNEDGSVISLTSHQLRVWLSTNAERGGMDSWRLAQWAGRSRIQDNKHYDLRTQKEREDQVNAVMQLEERPTALQALKLNLPVAYTDLGLHRVGIADVTEFGMCTHDYAMSPCTKGGECMSCKEHVCIKGMPETLDRIRRLEKQITLMYEKALTDTKSGVYGADRWVTHLGWKLAHIRTQRIRLESDETPEGSVLWISPQHDPSPIKRALKQQGYKTEIDSKESVDESIIAKLLRV